MDFDAMNKGKLVDRSGGLISVKVNLESSYTRVGNLYATLWAVLLLRKNRINRWKSRTRANLQFIALRTMLFLRRAVLLQTQLLLGIGINRPKSHKP